MVTSSSRGMMRIILLSFRLARKTLLSKFIYAFLYSGQEKRFLAPDINCEINKKILWLLFKEVNPRYFIKRSWKSPIGTKIVDIYEIKSCDKTEGLKTIKYTETECETTLGQSLNFDNYIENDRPTHKKKEVSRHKKFLEWFVGFTEGNGSFISKNTKVYFDITRSISDVQVLYKIKKELGFGKIILGRSLSRSDGREEKRNVAVFYVTSKENFSRLVCIFNGNLISNYKKNQFKNWLNIFNLQYKENVVFLNLKPKPSLTTSWLAGFIDAEGSFSGQVKYCRTKKIKKAVHLALTISQKGSGSGSGSKEVLNDIRCLFFKEDKGLSYDKSPDGWRVSISSFTKLEKVVHYLKLNPLKTEKHFALTKTKLILKEIKLKNHLTIAGLSSIEKSIKLLHNSKR